jgi:hypothetical protein
MLILEMPIVIELVMILVLFVMAVSLGLLSILTTTPPVLCHRNTCTKEGNYRCNQNNLYKFCFHGILLSAEICPLRRKGSGNGLQELELINLRGILKINGWPQKGTTNLSKRDE